MPLQDAIHDAIAGVTGGLVSAEDIERSIRGLLFGLLAGCVAVLMLAYGAAHLWYGRYELAALCALSLAAAVVCALWALRSGEYAGPLRALAGAVLLALGWATLTQGPNLPAAGWWMSIIPFILAGAGLHYLAMASVFSFVAIVTWLHFGSGLPPVPESVQAWQRYAAVVGSEMLALALIIVAMRRRAEVAKALEAAGKVAAEAATTKARFLATMSHEIRTPLNGVIGAAELLDSARISPEQRTQLVSLQQQSARTLLALLNDVLDMAKLEAGGIALERQPVYLRGVVFEANELFSVPAFAKGIELTSSCNPDVAGSFVGDLLRLRQIVNNLVSNAVKFTQRGGVHIHLSLDANETRPTPEPGQTWVRIEVVDSGAGIAPDVQALLFKPFVQADAGTSRRHGGTGLGLAISQDLARLMGGRIELRSRPGEGSCFALVVPLLPAAQGRADAPWTAPARRKDVVLATANRGLERHLKTLLHEMQVEPVVLDRLPLGLDDAAESRLLLVDAPLLQQADGAGEWLRAQHGAGRTVVLLTPLGADAVLGAPEDALLVYKPVRRRALQAAVATGLGSDAPPALLPDSPAKAAPEQGLHVLVAEDNPVNQVVVQAMLAEAGATCVVASDGSEALHCALAEPFDLVLMDLQMPAMDGLAVTRALRRAEQARGRPRVRVVAMTANTEQDEGPACLAAGMDGFLAKPFSLQQLRHCLVDVSAGSPSFASKPGPAT